MLTNPAQVALVAAIMGLMSASWDDLEPARMFQGWLEQHGFEPPHSVWVSILILIAVVAVVAAVAHRLTRWLVRRGLRLRFRKARIAWDDLLVKHGALSRLSHFVPALVLYHASAVIFPGRPAVVEAIHGVALVYMIAAGCLTSNAVGRAAAEGYEEAVGRERSIRSFVQVGEILVWLLGAILVLAIFTDRSPFTILGGFGAFAAVLVLVFRDALLGLVASVQLTRNEMLQVGDWIEMPSHQADGEVVEILLTTVKIQNWDLATAMVPSHALIQHAFVNWRSVHEKEARRLSRTFLVDYESIRDIDPELAADFPEPPRADDEAQDSASSDDEVAAPKTNLGAFRQYGAAYLRAHPEIRDDLILLVRTREPTEKGVPVQIYCFCRRVFLSEFAPIDSEVVEHFVAVAPRFGLRLMQLPSAHAVRSIGASS